MTYDEVYTALWLGLVSRACATDTFELSLYTQQQQFIIHKGAQLVRPVEKDYPFLGTCELTLTSLLPICRTSNVEPHGLRGLLLER